MYYKAQLIFSRDYDHQPEETVRQRAMAEMKVRLLKYSICDIQLKWPTVKQ